MRRRLITITLAAAVVAVASIAPTSSANAADLLPGGTFADEDGNVHEGYIEAIAAAGITSGCSTTAALYCPTDRISRAQMASFLARALDLPAAGDDYFDDDAGSPHEDNINRIAAAGITSGFVDGTFRPHGRVSRGQMASFLARAVDGLTPADGDSFTDDTNSVHEPNINIVATNGITVGCDADGTRFCPNQSVTRDQMASFVGRALALDEVALPAFTALSEAEALSLFAAYFDESDLDKALDIAECESNLDPDAWNPAGYGGLFQHAAVAWSTRAESAGWPGASIFNPQANTAVSAWLAYKDGWWHWGCA